MIIHLVLKRLQHIRSRTSERTAARGLLSYGIFESRTRPPLEPHEQTWYNNIIQGKQLTVNICHLECVQWGF